MNMAEEKNKLITERNDVRELENMRMRNQNNTKTKYVCMINKIFD